jgi:hypothetical protein
VPGYDHSVPPGQSPTASYGTGRHLRTIQSTPRMGVQFGRGTVTPILQRSITLGWPDSRTRTRTKCRSAEAPWAVDAPARPRDGGANQAVTAVHDSYRAPYPDLYLSLPRSDCDRRTLVPRFMAEPKTKKTGLALHGPVHDLCLYFRRQNQ